MKVALGVEHHRRALRALPPARWPEYLTAHSGLPGPRADLALAHAVAAEADASVVDGLIAGGDEYHVFCGVIGLGRLLAEGPGDAVELRLHDHAIDARWRVREAVALALQHLGDVDPARLRSLCATWAGDPDPLVQRAAIAGICEPRLLRDPETATLAVDLCEQLTASLAGRPAQDRRRTGVRALRKGLGYCWSVAVASDPARALPRFLALSASTDDDVTWIVRENRAKARLARLLGPRDRGPTID